MARRRMTETAETEVTQISENSASEISANTGDKRRRPRVMIPLNPDGTPDLSRVDPMVLDAIRNQTESNQPEPIQPEVIEMAINLIANIESAIVAPKFGIPQEQAIAVVMPQKPLKEQMAQAGAKVLSKYSGAMGKYQDEIVLGAMLLAWQVGVLNQLRAMKALQAQNQQIPNTEQKGENEA